MYVFQWWENLKIPRSLLLPYLRGWLSRVCVWGGVHVMYLLHYSERVIVMWIYIRYSQIVCFHLVRKVGSIKLRP